MTNEAIALSIVLIPVVGSFILPFIGRISLRLRNSLALAMALSSLVLSLALIPHVLSGKIIWFVQEMPLGFNFILSVDALAVFMAVVSSLVSSIIIFYSFGYISHYENQNEYYAMAVLFLGAMMGLVFSANLIFLYLFWEITAVTSWRLIGFFREKSYIIKADKAFLVTAFGALLMLIGFINIYQQTGSFDLAVIKEAVKTNPISNFAIALILIGIFSKSATLPFHSWLPDAGVAPSPVTAMLHAAVLVKIGVYVFARIFLMTFQLADFWHTFVPVVAAISMIVAAGAALVETDLKRIIAYSTVSQIGFILLALAIGNEIAIVGGLLFILMHGIAKAGLFLCAGIVEQNTKIRDITKLGGLITNMPITAISFLFCAFSVMGVPPFGGFFSKYFVFSGVLSAGKFCIGGIFLLGSFMTILYLFRVFNLVFLGEKNLLTQIKESSPTMIISVAILAVLSLLGGILIYYPWRFTQIIAGGMVGLVK